MLEYKEKIFEDLSSAKDSFNLIGGTVYFNYLPDGTIKVSGLWATTNKESMPCYYCKGDKGITHKNLGNVVCPNCKREL